MPYISYRDYGSENNEVTIMKYQSGYWEKIASENARQNFNMAVDKFNNIYIAYQLSKSGEYETVVKKYNGNTWVSLEESSFENTEFRDISIDSKGVPYVLYKDRSNSKKLVIKKRINNNWTKVKEISRYSTHLPSNSLAIDKNDYLYLLCRNKEKNKDEVQFFDGKLWSKLTHNDILSGNEYIGFSSISIKNNIVYLSYKDPENEGKLTVKAINRKITLIDKEADYLKKPKITYIPKVTNKEKIEIEISGNNQGEKIYINGGDSGVVLSSSKKSNVKLTMSKNGINNFTIILKSSENKISYPLEFSILFDKESPRLASGWPINKQLVKVEDNGSVNMIYTFIDSNNIKSIILLDENGKDISHTAAINENVISLNLTPTKNTHYDYTIIVTDSLGNESRTNVSFDVKVSPPITVASKPSGLYKTNFKVNLTSNEKSTIYYSINGYPPIIGKSNTKSGQSPISNIAISTSTNLQFFAVDQAGNKEKLKNVLYRFNKIESYDTNITAAYNSDKNQVELKWGSSGDTSKYQIYKTSSLVELELLNESRKNNYLAPKHYLLTDVATNSFIDKDIENGANYYYAVSKVNKTGFESSISKASLVIIKPIIKSKQIEDAKNRAKNWIFSVQNKNGSWGDKENLRLLTTTTVLDALKKYNDKNNYLRHKALGYVQSQYANNNDYLSRQIVTLANYDLYVENKVNRLISEANFLDYQSAYNIYGWGLSKHYKIDAYDTLLALDALDKSKVAVDRSKKLSKRLDYHVLDYLENAYHKNENDHWGWMPKGKDSIFVSAKVYKRIKADDARYHWIVANQNNNGSYGKGLLDTIGVILYLELDSNKLNKALGYILSQQNILGHFNNDPYITALSLQALNRVGQ